MQVISFYPRGMVNERFQPYPPKRGPYRTWARDSSDSSEDEVAEREPVDELGDQQSNAESHTEASSLSGHGEVTSASSSSEVESSDEENDDAGVQDGAPRKREELEDFIPGINCTKFECLLMIMNFSIRHGLTQVATQDLCKLINAIVGFQTLPHSKYLLRQIFGNSSFKYHFYCKNCNAYLGFRLYQDPRNGVLRCETCGDECHVDNMNNGHFFVTFPLAEQLKHLLENTENIMDLIHYRETRHKQDGFISDIFDGEIYSSLSQNGNFLSDLNNMSITFGVDGAQVFESTNNTLWPLIFRINELPPSVRFDFGNSLLGGLWFGKSEPSMPLYLKPFVDEINELYENGFTWHSPTGRQIRSKCILLNCVADSKAKPLVQGVKMHNGYWGCGYCNHPGKMYEGSSQAKYPLNNDILQLQDFSYNYTETAPDPLDKENVRHFEVTDRSNVQIRRDMVEAENQRNVRGEGDIQGVRGVSVLMNIPHFDLVFGFVVDYLHGVLLGVTKHVTSLWMDSTSSGELYYIGWRAEDVDKILLRLKPPTKISRRTRAVSSERCKWHANEWRSWLLYYSLPALRGILPKRYLEHHCLLVSAIQILLQDKISRDDLYDATKYLRVYCTQFSVLYSEPKCFFNVHLLLHLGKCVNLWGPLFCYSAFPFEHANGELVKLVKGVRGVSHQIADKYTKCKMIPKLLSMYNVRDRVLQYCEQLLCYRSCAVATKCDGVTLLGKASPVPFQDGELEALEDSEHVVTNMSYERMMINRINYHARCYRRKGERSDNSIVKLKCGSYAVIYRIIDPEKYRGIGVPRPLLLLKKINVERDPAVSHRQSGAKARHIITCSMIVYGDYFVATTDDVACCVILMSCPQRSFIAEFPNMYEKD
ncbi:Bifunctional protein Aas [Frankliniella fusca]|uniref:Bifunctional protein Aas n=1 Tax=Frankliniella fusca TaxID=407009 RepID=A0AAE1LPK1_9NEOP|nr:Bifunctional protein Aas [Frankliniella fusca]